MISTCSSKMVGKYKCKYGTPLKSLFWNSYKTIKKNYIFFALFKKLNIALWKKKYIQKNTKPSKFLMKMHAEISNYLCQKSYESITTSIWKLLLYSLESSELLIWGK